MIDGTSLLQDFGVWINGDGTYNGADPNIETVKIPGRNGDLIYSNRRYNNFNLTYKCAMPGRFEQNYPALRAFLYSNVGYRRIEDSYFPDMVRMGRITGKIDPSTIAWNNGAALFSISFDCKPQHYLKSGLEKIVFTGDDSIVNPTLFDAQPMIRVTGYGEFTLNGIAVTVGDHNYPYSDIDCEIQDGYYENINLNRFITISGDNFPVLSPGENELTFGDGITEIEIIPRYWTL